MRKKIRQSVVISIISLLLMSYMFTPITTASAEEIPQIPDSSTTATLITFLQDYNLIFEDEEIGVIKEGAHLFLDVNTEGENYIQFGDKEIVLTEEASFEYETNTQVNFDHYTSDQDYETVVLTNEETIFADLKFEKELASISASEVDYPILNQTEDYYEIIIGNTIGYVKKEQPQHEDVVDNKIEDVSDETEVVSEENATDEKVIEEKVEEVEQAEAVEETTEQVKEEVIAPQVTIQRASLAIAKQSVQKKVVTNPNYFSVKDDFLSVYDNSTGSLVKVGALVSGQVYPKVETTGNWIKIKYGNGYGYVWKDSTVDADPSTIKNFNKGKKNSNTKVISNIPGQYLSVYDNTSGELVRFATIQPGREYPVIRQTGRWYEIDYAGRIGYIYEPATRITYNGGENYFKVLTEFLSIYDNSTGKLVKVGSLIENQEFPIKSISGNWIKIDYMGKDGYVWKDSTEPSNGESIKNANKGLKTTSRKVVSTWYLSVYDNTSGDLVHFASIDPNIEYPIIEKVGRWYKIDVLGRIGYIYEPATKYVFNESDQYFKVNEDHVPIYDNRTGSLVEVGSLQKGQVFKRVSDSGNWHRIQFGDIFGYVYKDATIWEEGLSIKTSNVKAQDKNFLAIQDLPVQEWGTLKQFATIKKGQSYPIISQSGNWIEVEIAGRIGVVYITGVKIGPTVNMVNYNYTLDEMVAINSKLSTPPQTDKRYRTYVREDALSVDNINNPTKGTVTAKGWRVRGGPSEDYWIVGDLNTEYDKQTSVQILGKTYNKDDGYDWYEIRYIRTWVNASPSDTKYYLNPANFTLGSQAYYQFLKLSGSAGITGDVLNNKILNGQGSLHGMGDNFVRAGIANNVNEIYLLSHALLETGYGTSPLASGIKVKTKRDQDGNIVYTTINREKLKEIEVLDASATDYEAIVYNMYGIHAFDSCANHCGARKAFNEGWTSPEKAIVGGAEIIAANYIHVGQDTLYKMRWNPDNPGTHQYATDIGWATKQTYKIYELYGMLDEYLQVFEVPNYKK